MIDVAVAGATGLVGQRLVARLRDHAWFRLVALLADADRAGRPYGEVVAWEAPGTLPPELAGLRLRPPEDPGPARIVLSALPAAAARELEPHWAAAGRLVVGQSGAWPVGEAAPALPELPASLPPPGTRTGQVLAPNCTATGLVLALAPLRPLGLRVVRVVTLQARSGAGRRARAALGPDTAIPWIPGEEARITAETRRLLGLPELPLAVTCHRVGVEHGHLLHVAVAFFGPPPPAGTLREAWRGLPAPDLPSAVSPPLRLLEGLDRPQPRLDRDAAGGMAVSIGPLRPDPLLHWRFAVLVHNLERGAAGNQVLLAEAVVARAGGPTSPAWTAPPSS